MAKSECFCKNFSCESTLQQNIRFRFVKEQGVITDRINLEGEEFKSGLTPNDIAHCELKPRTPFKDKLGNHEPQNNYCDKGGHKERSLANQPNHVKHWNKEGKKHDKK